MTIYEDRVDAGRQLARRLLPLRGQDVVVLGLPRGGVPVAHQVAMALDAPLDVIVVRKLGVPSQPELAMGAIGEEGARVLDERTVRYFGLGEEQVAAVEERERAVLEERTTRFREGRERVDLTGRTALVVDDGIATGATARVACRIARQLGAARVVLAVPVAPEEAVARVVEADEVVCLATPHFFTAVGYHYRDFSPTDDDEVVALLDAAARRHLPQLPGPPGAGAGGGAGPVDQDVRIPAGGAELEGHLVLPRPGAGVVVFAHGSGSSRHSPRNRYVAEVLQGAGLGTLLLDLLTPREEADRANVFDIGLLAQRLGAATAWLQQLPAAASSPVGWFGASTGAGAALWAAAEPGARVRAVVSRGGRPDLAGPRLGEVRAPTLLVVGGEDPEVLALNRRAAQVLHCPHRLVVVPGATHLFEEPGTLAQAAELARDWFTDHLGAGEGGGPR
ncbi:dienelactone hydrolase family protein [Kocuria flava]|uniref:phosphoribosyltransferase family protein n=1 Tax=Kocuria flava TaxID=446860 RepID=UPI001FF280C6|nr:phosphoribosyltransferase family protein [Kocuria flava]MCJ8506044.1 dienelactone hydrolase family protein [Kocuria flava]